MGSRGGLGSLDLSSGEQAVSTWESSLQRYVSQILKFNYSRAVFLVSIPLLLRFHVHGYAFSCALTAPSDTDSSKTP
jgi:hypothetical protein